MAITLPLETMSFEEKMAVIETVWTSITDHPEQVPVPEHHIQLLKEREEYAASGKAVYYSLEEAKEIVRNRIRK